MTLSTQTAKLITAGIFAAVMAAPPLASAGALSQQRVENAMAHPQSTANQTRNYPSTARQTYSRRDSHPRDRHNDYSYSHGHNDNYQTERRLEEVKFQIRTTRYKIKRLRYKEAHNHNPRLRQKIARLGHRLDQLKDEKRWLKKRRDQFREADYWPAPYSRPNYNAYMGQ